MKEEYQAELEKKDVILDYFISRGAFESDEFEYNEFDSDEDVGEDIVAWEEVVVWVEELRRKKALAEEGLEHQQDGVEGQGDEESEKMEEGQSGMKELAK